MGEGMVVGLDTEDLKERDERPSVPKVTPLLGTCEERLVALERRIVP